MDYKLYWGEMHTHTYCGDSIFGSLEDAVEIAKTHLDFWAPAEHCGDSDTKTKSFAARKFSQDWEKMKSIIASHNAPGKFITFLGYENGFRKEGYGDHNIYFPNDNVGEAPVTTNFAEYVAFAKEQGAMLIPHHSAYEAVPYSCGINWAIFDPAVMPLIELYSMHGLSESDDGPFPMDLYWMSPRATAGTVQAALARGLKAGFIASSDSHGGYPGCYKMGLAAVYATELTREALWDAFWKRRTYAVSGDRIQLYFNVNGHMMGEEFACPAKRELRAEIVGEDVLDKIEIIKNNRVWHRETLATVTPMFEGRAKVRIEWGWGPKTHWKGSLSLSDGMIAAATPNFGSPGPNRIISVSERDCTWLSFTDGAAHTNWQHCRNGREGTNSIVFEVEAPMTARLDLTLNDFHAALSLEELLCESKIMSCASKGVWTNFKNKVKIHRAVCENQYHTIVEVTDTGPENDTDFYYLRVTQSNGQMAWSSPIWGIACVHL